MFIASKEMAIMINLEKFEKIILDKNENSIEFINTYSSKENPKIIFPNLEKAKECFTAISMRMGDTECMMIDSYLQRE